MAPLTYQCSTTVRNSTFLCFSCHAWVGARPCTAATGARHSYCHGHSPQTRHLPLQVRVPSFTAVVKQVACGYAHTLALNASGEVWAFGRNDYGQLGLGHVEDTW